MSETRPDTSHPRSLAGRPNSKVDLLGQVTTPATIARRMACRLLSGRPGSPARILDPCVGPYTFPLAMRDAGLLRPGDIITAIDADPDMFNLPEANERFDRIQLQCLAADYLELPTDDLYDFAILNPPYVRQEWLDKKKQYQQLFRQRYGVRIPGTSNLYVYFLVKVIEDLKPGAGFACIVYDAWQSTLYGRWLAEYMQTRCDKLTVESVSDQPFRNRLIDAVIIYGRKAVQGAAFAGNQHLINQADTDGLPVQFEGFGRIDQVFQIRRGLRLKQVAFFACDLAECLTIGATPFVKKIGRLKGQFSIPDSHPEAALLVTSKADKPLVYAELERRLEIARQHPAENASILTWHRERPDAWFLHQPPPYAPVLFNYYLRNRPRHIYNPARAYSDNFYGLVGPNGVPAIAWLAILNSTVVCAEILVHSRNQGSALAKIQLFEYKRVRVPDLRACTPTEVSRFYSLGQELIDTPNSSDSTLERVDELVAGTWAVPDLSPLRIKQMYHQVDIKARRPKGW